MDEPSSVGDEGASLVRAVGPPVDWGVIGRGVVDAEELADAIYECGLEEPGLDVLDMSDII